MIFDTDVVIWALRNHKRALDALDAAGDRELSVVSYLELIQGVRDKAKMHLVKAFIRDSGLEILPLSEAIGHRASIYVEEHALGSGLGVSDALIAATAAESGLTFYSGNAKHFRAIKDLDLKVFRP